MRRAVRMMRQAISPRLAIRTLLSMRRYRKGLGARQCAFPQPCRRFASTGACGLWSARQAGTRGMHILLRGSHVQRLRLAAGLVLFAFAATHLFNHALGLVSLDAMQIMQTWRIGYTRS